MLAFIRSTFTCLGLLVAGLLVAATANAAGVYRVNLDGSGLTTLVNGLEVPVGIALDLGSSQMYWTENAFRLGSPGKIQRANLNGSGVADIVTGLASPWGITLDSEGGQMYWTTSRAERIQRANLDGSGVTDLVRDIEFPTGIALDGGGQMYWTGNDFVQRASVDGTGVTDLVQAGGNSGIALDVEGGKMYLASRENGIRRANLDGSALTQLETGDFPFDIALDLESDHMYWTTYYIISPQDDDSRPDDFRIRRANLDGSEVVDILTGLDSDGGIALDLDARHIYFTGSVSMPAPIPLPISVWLFISALASLGFIGWRRNHGA